MELNAIREAVHKQPFQPFHLRLADGRQVTVRHPDYIALPESGRRVAVFAPQDDSLSILEPLLIVSIEYPATTTPTQSDGAGSSP